MQGRQRPKLGTFTHQKLTIQSELGGQFKLQMTHSLKLKRVAQRANVEWVTKHFLIDLVEGCELFVLWHWARFLSYYTMSSLKYYAYKKHGETQQRRFWYSQAVRVGDRIECAGQGMTSYHSSPP